MVEGVEVYPKEGYDWTAPAIDWTTNTEYYYGTWWAEISEEQRKIPLTWANIKASWFILRTTMVHWFTSRNGSMRASQKKLCSKIAGMTTGSIY